MTRVGKALHWHFGTTTSNTAPTSRDNLPYATQRYTAHDASGRKTNPPCSKTRYRTRVVIYYHYDIIAS